MNPIICLVFVVILIIFVNSSVTNLPVVFYSYGQLSASTGVVQWLKVVQCQESTANFPLLQFSIIQPENSRFLSNQGLSIWEISICEDSFAQSCIIATNYVKNGGQIYAFNNITIPYNSSISNLAFRYKAEHAMTPVSLHLSYVDNDDGTNPITNGVYDYTAFNTAVKPSTDATYFGQYVKTDVVGHVANSEYVYYYLSFCEKDISIHSQNNYEVNIQVSNDPSTPLAAFDLVACSAEDWPNYEADCTAVNSGVHGIVVDEDPASIVSVTLDGTQQNLGLGIYVGVFGYGGQTSNDNAFSLTVTENPKTN